MPSSSANTTSDLRSPQLLLENAQSQKPASHALAEIQKLYAIEGVTPKNH